MNLKATDIHFLNVSEKTQSVLREFYETVFCKFSVPTLYTGCTHDISRCTEHPPMY